MNKIVRPACITPALILAIAFFLPGTAEGQPANKPLVDTSKQKINLLPAGTVKPYKEVVPAGTRSIKSFFTVHFVNDRYLFEIPDTLLTREVLVVTRIDKAPAGFVIPLVNIGYSGDEIGKSVIAFEKVTGDKLALRSIVYKHFAKDSSSNGLSRSLENSNYQMVAGIFPVKAYNRDARSTVIDMTDFLNADNAITAFGLSFIKSMVGNYAADKSFVDNIHAYPENIEVKTVKTYNTVSTGFSTLPPAVTYRLNNSLLLLPAEPMKSRLADPRVGYFSNNYVDFDVNPFGVASTKYIVRWRLEPKEEDIEKYLRGELVEPKKPIVIYIDPATPKKWQSYLILGINDWQVAFEKAGFKNAIVGKQAPSGDTTWSIEDARHSVMVYKPSAIPNAMGPNINDPRSGEILETHINWYHSVMTLVKKWYIIQAGAIDPRAQKAELDDDLMGQLIRFVSSHEVGHTLGLMHNFGSSSTVPVENLRNKKWVEEHGHTPSIMDYARFNYVAQPEDGISDKGIFPRIGEYDKWAIEWGYKLIPEAETPTEERPVLNQWIINKLASGKQYFYGSQLDPLTNDFPMNSVDPRDQSEDLGDDAMVASSYGIKNLKRIMPHIMEWFQKPGENYDEAGEIYTELVSQFRRYMGHVARNIGGYYVTPKTTEQAGPQFELVEKGKQQRAIRFLLQELFATPQWLIDERLFAVSRTDVDMLVAAQNATLKSLMNIEMINRLIRQELSYKEKAYSAQQMLIDLENGIFSELTANKIISKYRRDLQNSYVENIVAMLAPTTLSNTETVVKLHARQLAARVRNASAKSSDALTREHLLDLYERLQEGIYPPRIVK